MLEVNFKDKNLRRLGNMFAKKKLPDETHVIHVDGQRKMEDHHHAFEQLTKMLRKAKKKVSVVELENVFQISPSFLALLIAISKKSDRLSLKDSFLGDPGFACLTTLMQETNGFKDFTLFYCEGTMPILTIDQAFMLFDGIARSTTLERLTLLQLPFGPNVDQAGQAFIHALRRNRSLKHLQIQMEGNFVDRNMITNILLVAILESKVKTIYYSQQEGGTMDVTTFVDILYRNNCSLETLCLNKVVLSSGRPQSPVKNSSLKSLTLTRNTLSSSKAVYIAKGCVSLTYLDVSKNNITDLAPFDRLLLGSEAKLERLVLSSNPGITDAQLLAFFERLPKMKTLKGIDMKNLAPLKSNAVRDVLLDAVWRNTSLQRVRCFDGQDKSIEDASFETKLAIPLALNWGGRGPLQNLPSNSIPRGLWTRILHRAATSNTHHYEAPQNAFLRSEVVFWLLRNKLLV